MILFRHNSYLAVVIQREKGTQKMDPFKYQGSSDQPSRAQPLNRPLHLLFPLLPLPWGLAVPRVWEPQQLEQSWAGWGHGDSLRSPFPFELSCLWCHPQGFAGKASQAPHVVWGVSRAPLEEVVSQRAGSPWMGSFTAILIFGFAFLSKSKTSFLADLTWIISKLLFLWVIWVWNQSEKINCAPSPRVFLYQLASEFP